ncbi:hypothetical protein F5X96DRAFT_663990 [Biscogniauxia mediterranea]|nr:hypothetical protein F5X96DRAFT_663990 [Biscogniauxia mediterranea]
MNYFVVWVLGFLLGRRYDAGRVECDRHHRMPALSFIAFMVFGPTGDFKEWGNFAAFSKCVISECLSCLVFRWMDGYICIGYAFVYD